MKTVPYYALDVQENTSIKSVPYQYKGIVRKVFGSGVVGHRFQASNGDIIDIPTECFTDEEIKTFKTLNAKDIWFQAIVPNTEAESMGISKIRLDFSFGRLDEYFVDDNWDADDYISIRYPYAVYRIRKGGGFDKNFFRFVADVSSFVYGTDLLERLGIISVENINFSKFPNVTVKATTLLGLLGKDGGTIEEIWNVWCSENDLESGVDFKIEHDIIEITFEYGMYYPFNKIRYIRTPTIVLTEIPYYACKNIDETRLWSVDSKGFLHLGRSSMISQEIWDSKRHIPVKIYGSENVKNYAKMVHKFLYETAYMGYELDRDGNLVRTTAFKLSTMNRDFNKIKEVISEVIEHSSYISEIEKCDNENPIFSFIDKGIPVSDFSKESADILFTDSIAVDYEQIGEPEVVCQYISDEIEERIERERVVNPELENVELSLSFTRDAVFYSILVKRDVDKILENI